MEMGHRGRRPVRGLVTALAFGTAAVTAAGTALVYAAPPAAAAAICTSKAHPKMAARLSSRIATALAGRSSVVGLKATDARLGLTCALNQTTHFYAASAIKATIISALLLKIGGRSHLTSAQRALAWNMITMSDNDAATALWNEVGISGMQNFLNRAGMKHTVLSSAWGLSLLTAQDEVTLLKLLTNAGKVLSTPSRNYVLYLMAHVISSQRWGVSAGAAKRVTVHIKNGWLPYPSNSDWRINSIGAFTGTSINYQIAILTSNNPSMAYGIKTIEGAAKYINWNVAAF
jgi:beta-lactamase class A